MKKRLSPAMRNLGMSVMAAILLIAGFSTMKSAYAANPLQQATAAVLADIGQVTAISEGQGPHDVYVFFDPNCPYCHTLFTNSRSFVKAGKVRLHWIPVGILTSTSHGKAMAMLGAKDPLQAFYQNENGYTRGNGGVDEDFGTDETERKLRANEAQWNRLRLGVVPLMLFYDKNGDAQIIQGAPPAGRLASIFASVK